MFSEGSTAVSRLLLSKELAPKQLATLLPTNSSYGHRRISIKAYDNELSRFVSDEGQIGNYTVFSLMIEEPSIDPTRLKLEIKSHLKEHEKNHGLISKRERSEIIADVTEQLAEESELKISIVQCAAIRKELFVSTNSEKHLDDLAEVLSTLDVIANQANALQKLFAEEKIEIETLVNMHLNLVDAEIHPEFSASPDENAFRSFLTWIHYLAQTSPDEIMETPMGPVEIFTGTAIRLEGEVLGAKTVNVKGGLSRHATELQAALRKGKLISKIDLQFAWEEGEAMYSIGFTLDDQGLISGLSLPKTGGPFAEVQTRRLNWIKDAVDTVDDLLANYLIQTNSDTWTDVLKQIKAWCFDAKLDR